MTSAGGVWPEQAAAAGCPHEPCWRWGGGCGAGVSHSQQCAVNAKWVYLGKNHLPKTLTTNENSLLQILEGTAYYISMMDMTAV